MFYIYTIHNVLNNKIYVGKTNNPHRRWQRHIYAANGQASEKMLYVHRAIAKYGSDNFVFSIFQQFESEKTAFAAEQYWIKNFNSRDLKCGYNLTDGGEGSSGRIVSPETRLKMSENHKGNKNYLFGKTISKEVREKFSKAKIGKVTGENNPNSKLIKENISDIKELRKTGKTLKEIAKIYNVSTTTISDICNNKIWKDIK